MEDPDESKLQKLFKNCVGVVNSQMNWFQIETKLRKIIHALVSPIVDRAHEERDKILLHSKQIKFH